MSMILIQRQVLSSSAASVSFTSIPQTYKTLRLVVSARFDKATVGGDFGLKINGSTSGYSGRQLGGDGSSAWSQSKTAVGAYAGFIVGTSSTGSTFTNTEILIPNYASAASKTWSVDTVGENNAVGAYQGLQASLWANSAAITSLELIPDAGTNLITGSSFYLYGIA